MAFNIKYLPSGTGSLVTNDFKYLEEGVRRQRPFLKMAPELEWLLSFFAFVMIRVAPFPWNINNMLAWRNEPIMNDYSWLSKWLLKWISIFIEVGRQHRGTTSRFEILNIVMLWIIGLLSVTQKNEAHISSLRDDRILPGTLIPPEVSNNCTVFMCQKSIQYTIYYKPRLTKLLIWV